MPIQIGLEGGGAPIRRRSGSGSGTSTKGLKVVDTREELHAQEKTAGYVFNGDIYNLFSITDESKSYFHFGNTDGYLYFYQYNITEDTWIDTPLMTMADVIDDLVSDVHDKPVSAAQAKLLYEYVLNRMEFKVVDDPSEVDSRMFYMIDGMLYYPYYVLNSRWYGIRYDRDYGLAMVQYTRSNQKLTVSPFVNSDMIANNLTTEVEGYVLDARQGKALRDSLDAFIRSTNLTLTNIQNNYVQQEQGKELIPTEDLERLRALEEFDDSELREMIQELQASKVDKEEGMGLSQENFTTALKTKLEALTGIFTIKGITNSLPLSGNQIGDVYFMAESNDGSSDIYSEYVWINSLTGERWERLGTTSALDLSNYYDKDQIDNLISNLSAIVPVTNLSTPTTAGFYSYGGELYVLTSSNVSENIFLRLSGEDIGTLVYNKSTGVATFKKYLTTQDIINDLDMHADGSTRPLSQYQGYLLNRKVLTLIDTVSSHERDGWEYINENTPYPESN